MQITTSTINDIDAIFRLYDEAVAFQKANSKQHWQHFERSLVEKEIAEGRQWKIMVGGEIACIFLVAYSDAEIWGDRNADPAMYIHRIVTNPAFRGTKYVPYVIEWAKDHCRQLEKKYLRMDT